MQELLAKYHERGVLLDSNLLVLLIVGRVDGNRVTTFKRTLNQGFTKQDYSLLEHLFAKFSKAVTTPHLLTETTNFIFELDGAVRQTALHVIAAFVQSTKERCRESKHLVGTGYFPRFGLTDSAILDLPPKKFLVLSVDAPLVLALQKRGVDAINFNHFRQLNWQQ